MTTKIISFTCIICLLCCFSFALTACQFEQMPSVVDAEINDSGELILIYQDGTEQNLGIVVGKDGSDGDNGEDGALVIDGYKSVISAASARGLRSAVSIVCNFKATVQQGGWRPGYGSTTTKEYSPSFRGRAQRRSTGTG